MPPVAASVESEEGNPHSRSPQIKRQGNNSMLPRDCKLATKMAANASVKRSANGFPGTTTISTLAIQSGQIQLVLAILQAGQSVNLKIVEMTPSLTYLGSNPDEANQLLAEQTKLIGEMGRKQCPVEELLKQADNLIVNQQPKAEVYSAMAESLGQAWKDLNCLLEERRHLLELNLTAHLKIQEFYLAADSLEKLCQSLNNSKLSSDEVVQRSTCELNAAKKNLLASSIQSLQAGTLLLNKLRQLQASPMIDSRVIQQHFATSNAIDKVELWLESVHDRRVNVTGLYHSTCSWLTNNISVLGILKDIENLRQLVASRKDDLLNTDTLGDSPESASSLYELTRALEQQAHHISEKCLKCVKIAQELDNGGRLSMETSIQAYDVLEQSAEYMQLIDNRQFILKSAKEFFEVCQSAVTSLENIEKEVNSVNIENAEQSMISELSVKTKELVTKILEEGLMLSERVGNGPGTKGVRHAMDRISLLGERVLNSCQLVHEKLGQSSRELRWVMNRLIEMEKWVESELMRSSEEIFTSHNKQSNLDEIYRLQDKQRQKLGVISTRIFELDGLSETCNTITSSQAKTTSERIQRLKSVLEQQKKTFESRILLSDQLARFLLLSQQLASEMKLLEDKLSKTNSLRGKSDHSSLEQSRMLIQQLYLQVCSTGKNLKEEMKRQEAEEKRSTKMASPAGQRSDAIEAGLLPNQTSTSTMNSQVEKVIEKHLEEFTRQQTSIIERWNKVETIIKETTKMEKNFDKLRQDVEDILQLAGDFDSEMYPMFRHSTQSSNQMVLLMGALQERKLKLNRTKVLPARLKILIKQVEECGESIQESPKKEQLLHILEQLKTGLLVIEEKLTEYEAALLTIADYLVNLGNLDRTFFTLEESFRRQKVPQSSPEAHELFKKHENCHKTARDLMASSKEQLEKTTEKVIMSLKTGAKFQPDLGLLEKTLNNRCSEFEVRWTDASLELTEHVKFTHFNKHQVDLSLEIDTLLVTVKSKLMVSEKLSSVGTLDAVLNPIIDQIKSTEVKVETLLSDGERLSRECPNHSVTIGLGLTQIKDKWNTVKSCLEEQKQKLTCALQYFASIEKAENFIKQSTRKLMAWSEIIEGQKSTEKAYDLIKEIDAYLKKEKHVQDENITRMTAFAGKIYGNDAILRVKTLQIDTSEAFASITALRQRLKGIVDNIKREKEEEDRSKKVKEEADLRVKQAEQEAKKAREDAIRSAQEALRMQRLEAMETKRRLKEEAEEEANRLKKRMDREALSKASCETQTENDEVPPPRPPLPASEATVEAEEQPRPVAPVFISLLEDKVIPEGQSCTLRAEVSGVPAPNIKWFKDGIPVGDNTDYIAVFDRGICLLSIEETMKEDSANWTVRASNQAGYAESHAKLTVQETKTKEEEAAPEFLQPLEDVSLKEGDSLKLVCKVHGTPEPVVSWSKNGENIDRSKHFRTEIDQGNVSLQAEKSQIEDSGNYTCTISNKWGQASSVAKIFVQPLEPTELPHFETPLSNILARTGQEVLLECIVRGIPRPEIKWFHDGRLIKTTSREAVVTYDGSRAALRIAEAFPKVAGQYVCRAQNIAGEATSTSTVSFKGLLPGEISDSETPDDSMTAKSVKGSSDQKQKPAFFVPLRNVVFREGAEVTLECIVIGNPKPEVTWYRGGKKLAPNQEAADASVRTENDENTHRLILTNVNKSSVGEYSVRAQNSEGESFSNCELSVQEPKSTSAVETQTSDESQERGHPKADNSSTHHVSQTSFIQQQFMTSTKFMAPADNSFGQSKTPSKTRNQKEPRFLTPLQGCMADAGDKVVLEGIVDGYPPPKLTWMKNGNPVLPSKDLKITSISRKTSLIINKVKESDSGAYCCKAENIAGSASSSADVVVKRKTLSPVFIKRLLSKTLLVGHKLEAEIEVGGQPLPQVKWFFNNEEIINDGRRLLKQKGNVYSLTIDQVQEQDSGQYSVEVVNAGGQAFCVADIAVYKDEEASTTPPPTQHRKGADLTESDQGISRSVSPPAGRQAESRFKLGQETRALRTLAADKRNSRPLPDLLPFPFKPDEPQSTKNHKKNFAKVPKPSKFVKGEMYHSDYESDFEGRIAVMWRPACYSDSEDSRDSLKYRKIKPNLRHSARPREDRRSSPPCPHVWESHEEIAKLESELKELTRREQLTGSDQQLTLVSSIQQQRSKETIQMHLQQEMKSETETKQSNSNKSFATVNKPLPTTYKVITNESMTDSSSEHKQFGQKQQQCFTTSLQQQRMWSGSSRSQGFTRSSDDMNQEEVTVKTEAKVNRDDGEVEVANPIFYEATTTITNRPKTPKTVDVADSASAQDDRIDREREAYHGSDKVAGSSWGTLSDVTLEINSQMETWSNFSYKSSTQVEKAYGNEYSLNKEQSGSHCNSISRQIHQDEGVANDDTLIPPPIPPKLRTSALTPSPSRQTMQVSPGTADSWSEERSSSQSTVLTKICRTDYVRVKEKVKHFEQKVEEDLLRTLDDSDDKSGSIRPENIPGAVRILPTPTPPGSRPLSRKGSIGRSQSIDYTNAPCFVLNRFNSPINVPRSLQESPCFGKRSFDQENGSDDLSSDLSMRLLKEKLASVDATSFSEDKNSDQVQDRPSLDLAKMMTQVDRENVIQSAESARKPTSKINGEGEPLFNAGSHEHAFKCSDSEDGARQDAPPRPPYPEDLLRSDTSSSFEARSSFSFQTRRSEIHSSATYTSIPTLELVARGQEFLSQGDTTQDPSSSAWEDTLQYSSDQRSHKFQKRSHSQSRPTTTTEDDYDTDKGVSEAVGEDETKRTSLDVKSVSPASMRKRSQTASPGKRSPRSKSVLGTEEELVIGEAAAAGAEETSDRRTLGGTKLLHSHSMTSMDRGYEADTETLTRRGKLNSTGRRGSVKQLAARFQEAEDQSPSPIPFRPKHASYMDGVWEAPQMPRSSANPGFQISNAYVPPKWTQSSSTSFSSTSFSTSFRGVPDNLPAPEIFPNNCVATANLPANSDPVSNGITDDHQHQEVKLILNGHLEKPTIARSTEAFHQSRSPVIFKPTKFVPGGEFQPPREPPISQSSQLASPEPMSSERIPPIWSPTPTASGPVAYRPVRPCLTGQEAKMTHAEASATLESTLKCEESRTSTSQLRERITEKKNVIDETALVYFKYDLGYEFGLVNAGNVDEAISRQKSAETEKQEGGRSDIWIKRLEDTTCEHGQTLELEVRFQPNSIQDLVWCKDGTAIKDEDLQILTDRTLGKSKLIKKEASSLESGTYEVRLQTHEQTVETSFCRVTVRGFSNL